MTPGPVPQPARTASVLLGRRDYASTVLRLIGMEFYKIRRRAMSKIVSIIAILATLGMFVVITLITLEVSHSTGPEAQSMAQALHLPLSLYFIAQILLSSFLPFGPTLIVILAGIVVGGEYTSGTIRLMYTRGPTRTQILLGKIGALLLCILLAVAVVTLVGVASSSLLNLATAYPQDGSFFSASWLGSALLYLLFIVLGLFVYSMMALMLATVGRASAAGIAGVLVWILVIEPVANLMALLTTNTPGVLGSIFRSLPDYTISKNIDALLAIPAGSIFGPAAEFLYNSQLSMLHALIVLAAYLAIFAGLSWWAIMRRDVTN